DLACHDLVDVTVLSGVGAERQVDKTSAAFEYLAFIVVDRARTDLQRGDHGYVPSPRGIGVAGEGGRVMFTDEAKAPAPDRCGYPAITRGGPGRFVDHADRGRYAGQPPVHRLRIRIERLRRSPYQGFGDGAAGATGEPPVGQDRELDEIHPVRHGGAYRGLAVTPGRVAGHEIQPEAHSRFQAWALGHLSQRRHAGPPASLLAIADTLRAQ